MKLVGLSRDFSSSNQYYTKRLKHKGKAINILPLILKNEWKFDKPDEEILGVNISIKPYPAQYQYDYKYKSYNISK